MIDEDEDGELQSILTNDDERAAIVPIGEWNASNQAMKGTLAEFFRRSGLDHGELDITRHPDTIADLRKIEF